MRRLSVLRRGPGHGGGGAALLVAVVLTITLLAACGGGSGGPSLESRSVTLSEVNNSGFQGEAMLAGFKDGPTSVVITLGQSGTPQGNFPVGVNTGTCQGLAGEQVFDLGSMRNGFLSTELNAPLDQLTGQDHAIVIYQSGDRSVFVACGDI